MIFVDYVNINEYFIAEYELEGKESLYQAARVLAICQSVGNPHVRNKWVDD